MPLVSADFSVLMSVYYNEKPEYLSECIDSILGQSVMPAEIVIIKDGPLTFELDTVLDKYVSKNPNLYKIIELKENVGLGRALAIGIDNCSYDLVARMDTDDIARSDRFEKQLRELQEDDSLDIIGSHIIEFENNIHNELAKRIMPIRHDDIYNFAKRRNPFNHMTVMYKRQKVINAGNYQPAHGAEDYFLWARMLKQGCNAKNIDDYLVYARTGHAMLARRNGLGYMRNAVKTRWKIHRLGLSGLGDCLISCTAIGVMSMSPSWVKEIVYKRFLRE